MPDVPDIPNPPEQPWQRFLRLLGPVHAAAAVTARRLARSPLEGDDLLQEAVLRAFDRMPLLRDEASFRSWFYAVLLSVHRTRARRDFWKRFRSLDQERESGWEPSGGEAPDGTEVIEAAQRAARALAALPAVQREAIVLFELEGYSLEEVTGLQSTSLSAVKTRLARGRERLRAFYVKRGWAPPGAALVTHTGGPEFAGDPQPLTEGSTS